MVGLMNGPAALGQPAAGTIAGTLLDASTRKPVPVAWVTAIRDGVPSLSRTTKSGAGGEFKIDGLPAGRFTLCVQAPEADYLDPCQWSGSPAAVTLTAGQTVSGISVALTAAVPFFVNVEDGQKTLELKTKDGRQPHVSVGVWGPNGLYYPARALPRPGGPEKGPIRIPYKIGLPRGIALRLDVSSGDLKLGDAGGKPLAGNASRETVQYSAADSSPKKVTITVLGLLP
jgi:hypothetical protein